MTDYLDVQPDPVVTAGHRTAATSDEWGSWADRIRTAFGIAREEVRNARIISRMESYASDTERGARYVSSNVETLGSNTASAGNVITNADGEAVFVLRHRGSLATSTAPTCARPIGPPPAVSQ